MKGIYKTFDAQVVKNDHGIPVKKCCTMCANWQINTCYMNIAASFSTRRDIYCEAFEPSKSFINAGDTNR